MIDPIGPLLQSTQSPGATTGSDALPSANGKVAGVQSDIPTAVAPGFAHDVAHEAAQNAMAQEAMAQEAMAQ
ncbi:MAG: hypothetical protein ACKO3W_13885, partial [bacterium]